jgi:hypothetical protein
MDKESEQPKTVPEGSQASAKTPLPEAPKSSSTAAPATPSLGGTRAEHPTEPYHLYRPFQPKVNDTAIGNPEFVFAMKAEGRLGIFYPRANTTREPTLVEVDFAAVRDSAAYIIGEIMIQAYYKLDRADLPTMTGTVQTLAPHLADGVCVMLYKKLRALNYMDGRVDANYRFTPQVPEPFEVLLPYALAIQQIGKVKISGMTEEKFFSPTAPAGMDASFGLPLPNSWNPMAYSRAVDIAKKLGLSFATPDLTVKMGSPWWLYRPVQTGISVTLQCPFPEENFTESTAVLAGLFCYHVTNGLYNPIIELNPLGNANYGTMLRNAPPDFALNVYYAISAKNELVYKIGN